VFIKEIPLRGRADMAKVVQDDTSLVSVE